MVQNRVTISASIGFEGPSAKPSIGGGPKKRGQSSMISQYHPPPPAKTVGGGGRISREICRFSPFAPSFGGEGSILREKCRISGNHQHNRKGRFIRLANDGNSLAENDPQLGHAMAACRPAIDFKSAKRSNESRVDLFLASRGE